MKKPVLLILPYYKVDNFAPFLGNGALSFDRDRLSTSLVPEGSFCFARAKGLISLEHTERSLRSCHKNHRLTGVRAILIAGVTFIVKYTLP